MGTEGQSLWVDPNWRRRALLACRHDRPRGQPRAKRGGIDRPLLLATAADRRSGGGRPRYLTTILSLR